MQFHYFLACFSVYLFVLVCSCLWAAHFKSYSHFILVKMSVVRRCQVAFLRGWGWGVWVQMTPPPFFQRSYWFIVLTKKWLNTLTSYCWYDIKVKTKLESSSDTTPWVSSDKKSCNLVGWKIWHSSPLFCNV